MVAQRVQSGANDRDLKSLNTGVKAQSCDNAQSPETFAGLIRRSPPWMKRTKSCRTDKETHEGTTCRERELEGTRVRCLEDRRLITKSSAKIERKIIVESYWGATSRSDRKSWKFGDDVFPQKMTMSPPQQIAHERGYFSNVHQMHFADVSNLSNATSQNTVGPHSI
jgi:hypothetical protein